MLQVMFIACNKLVCSELIVYGYLLCKEPFDLNIFIPYLKSTICFKLVGRMLGEKEVVAATLVCN